MSKEEQAFLKDYNIHDFDVPLLSVDMAIFGIMDSKLNVLLVNRQEHPSKGLQALPGGFVNVATDADLESTAHRKLTEKTGIQSPYLEQVETIGNQIRDPRGWSVTVLYFALIDVSKIKRNGLSDDAFWHPVNNISKLELAFDHKGLISKAFERLINKTCYTALPLELLPREFTLTECQTLFELLLGKKLQAKSFRKRFIDAGVVIETGKEKLAGKRHAALYRSAKVDRNFVFPRALIV